MTKAHGVFKYVKVILCKVPKCFILGLLIFLLNKGKLYSYLSATEIFNRSPLIFRNLSIFADPSVQIVNDFPFKKIKSFFDLTLVLGAETSQLVVAIRGKVQSKPVLAANDG